MATAAAPATSAPRMRAARIPERTDPTILSRRTSGMGRH